MRKILNAAALLILFLTVSCGDKAASISICGLNYTDRHISSFSVNGYGAGNIYANEGGGGFVCCISVPKKWHKGLTATVRWADNEADLSSYKEKIVEIPEYGPYDLGFLAVHFYDDDSVRILVTTKSARYPGYPYPRPTPKK